MTHEQLARALFNAFEADDLAAARAVCSPALEASQNGGPIMDADALLGFSHAVSAVIPDFHYEDIRCAATSGGFVEEHTVCGTLPDGKPLRLSACVVGDVEDGRIHRLREYADSRAAAGLLQALA